MKELDLLIQQSTNARALGMIYRATLANTNTKDKINKPSELEKSQRGLSRSVRSAKDIRAATEAELEKRSRDFQRLKANAMEATNLAAKSLRMQLQLEQYGGTYGEAAVNFVLDPLKLKREQVKQIEETALEGLKVLKSIPTSEIQKPNGARVDIILGNQGPRIIEINSLWVDGFGILESLNKINGGIYKPLETFVNIFSTKRFSKLGIVFINPATGSREKGEQDSLAFLSQRLIETNQFNEIEILDPKRNRIDYINSFPALYVNGDPRMKSSGITDLITLLNKRLSGSVFPTWCPKYEDKRLLISACLERQDLFAATYPFSRAMPAYNWILKGNSFSSQRIAMPNTEGLKFLRDDALQFPDEYVYQEKITSTTLPPTWVFDTSSNIPRLLEKPNCKFNVWIVKDKVAGIMASLSDNLIISDKDFNCVPIGI
jgi:hypothetical protein